MHIRIRTLCLTSVLGLLLLTACNGNEQPRNHNGLPNTEADPYVDEDTTQVTLEEAGGDSLLVGSTDYSEVARTIEMLQARVEATRSPDMLLVLIDDFAQQFSEARKAAAQVEDPTERQRLQAQLGQLHNTYNRTFQANTIPAAGVVDNLRNLQQRLQSCTSRAEFIRITDPRRSFFQHLPTLHLIIAEHNQQRIVRQLARQVESLYRQRSQQYDVR